MNIDQQSLGFEYSKPLRAAVLAFFTAIGTPAEAQQLKTLPEAKMRIQTELERSQKTLEETGKAINDLGVFIRTLQDPKSSSGQLAAAIHAAAEEFRKKGRVPSRAQKK